MTRATDRPGSSTPKIWIATILTLVLAAVTQPLALAQGPVDPVDRPFAPPPESKTPRLTTSSLEADLIPNQYIVVFRDDVFFHGVTLSGETPRDIAERLTNSYFGELHYVYEKGLRGFVATFPAHVVPNVQTQPEVAYLEADHTTPEIPTPALPEIGAMAEQFDVIWNLDRIDQRDLPLDNGYTYYASGAGVHAYIVDTGLRASHSEFSGRVSNGYDFIDMDSDPDDCHGHGTHVAGTVGGTTYGVAKDVTLHAVRVLNCSGSGTWSGVIAGINWVRDNHQSPAVINMSLGGGYSQSINDAVASAHAAGVTVVVAAGNESTDACSRSPASAPEALTIGAITSTDARSYFSNYGTCVDIFAPGSSVKAAWIGSDTAFNTISGTSMASPHVAGAAALYLETNSSASPDTIAAEIAGSASIDKISSVGTGSPNRLLFTGDVVSRPLQVTPSTMTTCVGDNATYTVNINEGLELPVSLVATGHPAGTDATFAMNPVTAITSTILTISNTNQAATGDYNLELTGTSASATVSATVRLTLLDIPGSVSLISPADGAADVGLIPTLQWSDAPHIDTYSVEIATDPAFSSTVITATVDTNSYSLTQRLEPITTYYWRVRANNQCGNGAFVAPVSFNTGPAPSILLVDDDDNYPDVRSYYTLALDAQGERYDVFDTVLNSEADPDASTLSVYNTVIWFTGADFYDTAGPDSVGETALTSYLSQNDQRCLFISSQDYLWAQGIDIDTPNSFMTNYLGAAGASSDWFDTSVTGLNGFSSLGEYNLDFPYYNYIDWIFPDMTAEVAFTGDSSQPVGISKITAEYRTVWWGFPLEAIPSPAERQAALAHVLNWCANNVPTDVSLSSSTVQENQPAGTVVGSFTSTDPDTGDTHVYTLVSGEGDADNSSFSIAGNTLKTAASFNYEAQSSYTVRVQSSDQLGGKFAKPITISVENVYEAPIAVDDAAVTLVNTPVDIEVLGNDIDPDGDTLTLTALGNPSGGIVVNNGGGNLTYTPANNLTGQDVFTYVVSDGILSATAEVTVTVIQADEIITADPATQHELIYTGSGGAQTNVQIPVGAVTETLDIIYTELTNSSHPPPANTTLAGRIFTIDAFVNGKLQEHYSFSSSISVTLTYNPDDLGEAEPGSLQLRYWDQANQRWQADGITWLAHNSESCQIIYSVNHLTEFALMVQSDPAHQVFLPVILK